LTQPSHPITDPAQLLRWWHRHQAQWLTCEADRIRNGLLQDLFAVRRQLELQTGENGLGTVEHLVEHLYADLDALGNRLSSPYAQESLPLAIQHALQDWPPALALKLNLPTDWPDEPTEHISLLLLGLDHLRHTLMAQASLPQSIHICLVEQVAGKQLTLDLSYDDAVPPGLLTLWEAEDWLYPVATFEVLSQGRVSYRCESNTLEWIFDW